MNRFINVLSVLMLMTAMLFTVGCKKDNSEESGGGNGGGNDTSFNINAMADPADGGTVTGSGTYEQGDECTLTATANDYYVFMCWTENGEVVSDAARYTFLVTRDRTLEANFSYDDVFFSINAVANPQLCGTIAGIGTYCIGTKCTLTATAKYGYTFVNWTENDEVVSTEATYAFTVTGDRSLVANFIAPIGAINGVFSVSANKIALFSQGNLQYQASTDTWRFAENQYDYVGSDNSNISSTYSGWIDLFGWGTSGYHKFQATYNVNYQPWSTSTSEVCFYPTNYGATYYHGYGPTPGQSSWDADFYDWGYYNQISNGGNNKYQWHTLTDREWGYVFNDRTTTSGIRYAKANVNNVNGVIMLPDDWSSSTYSLSNTNSDEASFSSNTLTASQWSILEKAGAVFLPAAGYREDTSVYGVGSDGYYWTFETHIFDKAYRLRFYDLGLIMGAADRYYGHSVRLVRVAEN
ncbi:MAG: hypothetical protein IKS65_03965 [Bacteroidales bacterium]|nr:hypothetical protein [Bacteroidales bacterium]